MRIALTALASSVAALCAPSAAHAGTASATIAVSVVIEPSCTVAASPLTFQGAKTGQAGVTAQSEIAVACTPDQGFSASLDSGSYASGGTRRMMGEATGTYVSYEIFADAARSRSWSNVDGVAPHDGAPVVIPAYARITQATAQADRYTDVVTVSIVF